ncbi:Uncharacterised protein [Achromobacter sp. 2789STDY5608615]|nr:Uncharacterised protein [Achromobacter sp. 2789STDY5608615]
MRRGRRVLRRQPGRMAGAVGIAEAGDGRRADLHLAAGRGQRLAGGIVAERAQDAAVVVLLRQRQFAARPELVEVRRLQALVRERRAGPFIQVAQPFGAVAAFGEGFARAQPFGQVGEDVVVVARQAVGRGDAVHGHQQRVGGRAADVLALQRHRAGQHDVGMARGGGPADLVDHEGVERGEGAGQALEVLVMVERIAAGPIGQADVRIVHALAVVVERLAGVQQHVGDARHGNEILDAVGALRQRRHRHRVAALAVVRQRAQRIGVAAARQAQLPQRRGQHRAHPDGLFAVFGALQRMRHRHQHALARQQPRDAGDLFGRHAADRRGPGRVLGLAIRAPHQVVLEAAPAFAEVSQERLVVPAVGDQFMHQRQHQRHVGAGHGANPLRRRVGRQVGGQRADVQEAAAASRGLAHRVALDVAADAAAGHARILQRHAAEGQHHVGMRDDLFPGDVAARHIVHAAQDVRQDHRRGAGAVAVDRAHVTAQRGVQEAVHLALRVMEAAGAGPAVRAAEHRLRAVLVAHPAQFGGQQVQRLGPADRHIVVAPSARVRSRPAFQPAAPHHRRGDARRVIQRVGEVLDQRIGIGVARMRPHLERAVFPRGGEDTPVRAVGQAAAVGTGRAGGCVDHGRVRGGRPWRRARRVARSIRSTSRGRGPRRAGRRFPWPIDCGTP